MWPQTPAGDGSSRNGTAHVAFSNSDSLGPCDFKDFVAQSHTPSDHCVRFVVVVTFPDATLVTRRALPLTWAGLSPAGSRQLRLAHRESFIGLSRPGPVTIPRYAPFPVRGSVHLSRQFLEKLTESAIIKVALREDLSEVATGSRWLAASPHGR
jgi:hypothetical protein